MNTEQNKKPSFLQSLMKKNILIVFLHGFISGMPLLLTLRTLQAWMTDAGVDLKTTGAVALFGLPYSLKFLWAPLLDRYQILNFGRRKGWLYISQIGVAFSIFVMASVDPKEQTLFLATMAVLISFFSATQDIVIDAYRRELLPDNELGLGSTFYIYGYRIAMWVSGAFALGMAQYISWQSVYYTMAAIQLGTLAITFFSEEPQNKLPPPKNIKEAIIEPFKEFLSRKGALLLLAFVLMYKVGDTMAGNMLTPFYLKMGYEKIEIAAIAKTFSLFATLIGGFIGGVFVQKYGIFRSLMMFGISQATATALFSVLYFLPHNNWALGAAILGEDITAAMGSAAFVAYMGSITNKRFTATQFALLSSLMGVPRTIISAPTGWLAESMGWPLFFIFCGAMTIPALLMIKPVQKFAEVEKVD